MAAAYRLPSPFERPPLRRRVSGLGLALGVNLLILLALLTLGVRIVPRPPSEAIVVDMLPDSPAEVPEPAAARPEAPITPPPPRPAVLPPPIVQLPPRPTLPDKPLEMIIVTPQEYAASDIGKMSKAADAGPMPGDSEEVGRGPNGETLYAAEWAREPTDTELRGYLPAKVAEGYGVIACRTAPGNRVEDCVEIGQSPGSRLAGAVRQAAWQFRVRPPRKNGRALIGEWVRIRIEYVKG